MNPKLFVVLSVGNLPEIVDAESGELLPGVEILDLDDLNTNGISEAARRYLAAESDRLRNDIREKEEVIRTWQGQVAEAKRRLEKMSSAPYAAGVTSR